MAGNSEWNKAVKQAFKMGRKTSKSYSLKEAMIAAKKIYRKGKTTAMSMGKQTRRRSGKKGYKRRMSGGSDMMQNISKMAGLGNSADASVVANKTEAPLK